MGYKRKEMHALSLPLPRLSNKVNAYTRSHSEDDTIHGRSETSQEQYEPLKRSANEESSGCHIELSANSVAHDIESCKKEISLLLKELNFSSIDELRTDLKRYKTSMLLKKFGKEINEVLKKLEFQRPTETSTDTMNADTEDRKAAMSKLDSKSGFVLNVLSGLCEFRGNANTDMTVAPVFDSLLNRLSSLHDFSPGIDISLSRLASAGFYKLEGGQGMTTKCYLCGVVYDKWKSGDNPMTIHKMLNPTCEVVTQLDATKHLMSQNETNHHSRAARSQAFHSLEDLGAQGASGYSNGTIAATESRMTNTQEEQSRSIENENVNSNANMCQSESSNNTVINNNSGGHQMQPAASYQNEASNNCESLGIFTSKPKYPNYATMQSRIASYRGWPAYLDQTAEQMSAAGFLYAGYNDYTRCFSCGGGLRNWEAGDDPWVEHARWFPKCSYLRQNKGDFYITTVQKKHQDLLKQTETESTQGATSNMNQVTTNSNAPRISYAKDRLSYLNEGRSSQENLQTVAVMSVLEMGYKREDVVAALAKLHQLGKDESRITATDIMHVLLGDEIEVQASPGSSGASTNPQPKNDTAQHEPLPTLDDTELLLEENNKLKDQLLCKVCLDLNATIAFLPCGHIVCCVDCAPAMRKCPVCRAHVKGTVKTYLV